jgi:hypothetical protein
MPALTLSLGLRGNLLSSTAPTPAFSPASLFALSEPGVWYDPSDLTTMFTDTAGTTQAAVGQAVALVLDKSKGLVLGSELVTNGTFDGSATGWTLANGATYNNDAVDLNVANGVNVTLSQTLPTPVVGRSYRITYTISNSTTGILRAQYGGANTGFVGGNGTVSRIVVATSTVATLNFNNGANTYVGTIDNISVKELPGFHATQSTTTARPILRQDGGGRYYLEFDGTDDWLVTPTITPGVTRVQVFAGVRKLSDAAAGILVESSINSGANNGSIALWAPNIDISPTSNYAFRSRGTNSVVISATTFAAATTNILTGIGHIFGDAATLRVDGTQVATSATDQGAGNFLAYPLYIGRRGGTTLPFNGHLYSLVVRFGENLDAGTISSTEGWVAGKTGINLPNILSSTIFARDDTAVLDRFEATIERRA